MYSAWKKASEKLRYSVFKPALEAAIAKLDEYYRRMAESDAYIIAMGMLFFWALAHPSISYLMETLVLDPRKKFRHFEKNWDADLQADVKELVQKKVCTLIMMFPLKFNNVFQVYWMVHAPKHKKP